mmetsp:Transcript_12115/g.22458  ORF Transcript_12115/g.22458 Transcript_12115/m.22458 type:complete len:354 (+) Transcript_12115:129-1190(+)
MTGVDVFAFFECPDCVFPATGINCSSTFDDEIGQALLGFQVGGVILWIVCFLLAAKQLSITLPEYLADRKRKVYHGGEYKVHNRFTLRMIAACALTNCSALMIVSCATGATLKFGLDTSVGLLSQLIFQAAVHQMIIAVACELVVLQQVVRIKAGSPNQTSISKRDLTFAVGTVVTQLMVFVAGSSVALSRENPDSIEMSRWIFGLTVVTVSILVLNVEIAGRRSIALLEDAISNYSSVRIVSNSNLVRELSGLVRKMKNLVMINRFNVVGLSWLLFSSVSQLLHIPLFALITVIFIQGVMVPASTLVMIRFLAVSKIRESTGLDPDLDLASSSGLASGGGDVPLNSYERVAI